VHNPKPYKQAPELTRDAVARMLVVTLDQVLATLQVQQTVDGIAVLPAGEGVYLVDIVMRDQTSKSTWGLAVIIPPSQEELEKRA
jgi:hypothetical protein